jgi:hypothetical protein
MENRIWELPGPSSFIRDVVQDLKNGINVIIHIPKYNFHSFDQYLKSALKEELNWYDLKPDIKGELPLGFLVRNFLTEKNSHTDSLEELIELNDIMRFLWLDFSYLEVEDKQNWLNFLYEYIRICDQVDRFKRIVFCFNISEKLYKDDFNSSFVNEHFFYDCVSELDFKKTIEEEMGNKSADYISTKIIQETIFELSFPNFDLAIHLLNNIDKLFYDYLELFEEYLTKRNITFNKTFLFSSNSLTIPKFISCPHPLYEYWLNNLVKFSNGIITNSALNYYCRGGNQRALIKQSIWKAQLTVLFPILELYRVRIIEYMKITGKVKILVEQKIINKVNDIYAFEIGKLFHHLITKRRKILPMNIENLLIILRDIRNDIAHLNVVSQNRLSKLKDLTTRFDKEFLS